MCVSMDENPNASWWKHTLMHNANGFGFPIWPSNWMLVKENQGGSKNETSLRVPTHTFRSFEGLSQRCCRIRTLLPIRNRLSAALASICVCSLHGMKDRSSGSPYRGFPNGVSNSASGGHGSDHASCRGHSRSRRRSGCRGPNCCCRSGGNSRRNVYCGHSCFRCRNGNCRRIRDRCERCRSCSPDG